MSSEINIKTINNYDEIKQKKSQLTIESRTVKSNKSKNFAAN